MPNGILGVDLRRVRPAANRGPLVGWYGQVIERILFDGLAAGKPRVPQGLLAVAREVPGGHTGGRKAIWAGVNGAELCLVDPPVLADILTGSSDALVQSGPGSPIAQLVERVPARRD